MSKTSKRKSGGESSKNSKSLSVKDSHKRPSVFERLGTKASSIPITTLSVNVSNQIEFCRAWVQNGTCPFGKSCKLSYSHTLISPSKRSVKKEDLDKRVQSSLARRSSPSEVGLDWESWDQSELEYEDEKVLERRRQLLQRELELQLKKESQKQDTNKRRSSSTSSDSSSSSSSTSSSGSSSDSSLSTKKKVEPKIQSPSLLERSIIIKKNMGKGIHKESPPRKSSTSKKISPPRKTSRRKSVSPIRKQLSPLPKSKPTSLNRASERSGRRNDSPVPSRGRSPDRKQASRSSGSSRRSPRPSVQRERRGRSPRNRPPSRNRTPDRRKDEDRRGRDDSRRSDKKSDPRDKREAAREKERLEALERCRERQRERDALAKERERERKERDKRRRGTSGYTSGSTSSRRTPPREEKRHDRKTERDRSYSRERARDRALERVMERRGSSRERSYERPYPQNSPSYRGGGNERSRYGSERVSSERGSTREERRGRRWLEGRDKQSGSREWSDHPDWENRSRCEERSDDWRGYSGPGNGSEWRARSHLSHHDDRRSHHTEKEKDHSSDLPKEKESKDLNQSSHSKRSGEDLEMDVSKRSRLDEVSLQEELSDISDDPDDILNREDEVFTDREIAGEEGDSSLHDCAQPHTQEESSRPMSPAGERNIESRIEDDVIRESLDFEEISDEELEEESKSNKGASVVDALGVDWASLVAEWRPPRETAKKGSARANWSSEAVFRRVGISADLAGEQLLTRITKTYLSDEQTSADKAKCLPSTLLQNKRALSARTDIIIRRQLCGLPVISSETHPTTGLCQWAV